MQKIFFVNSVEAGFSYRRSVEKIKRQLIQAAFSDFEILPDTKGMFVNFVSQKHKDCL